MASAPRRAVRHPSTGAAEVESHYDTVIIGGAAMGSAAAYFLSENPDYDGSVLVVEADPTYARCSTTMSAASVRQQFSNPVNIALSQFGSEFIARFDESVHVDGESPELAYRETGYLFLATEGGMPLLSRSHETQVAAGVRVTLLDPDRLASRFPYLRVDDLAGASLGLAGEGSLDAHSLMQGLRRRARHNGVPYLADRVIGLDKSGDGRITGVRLASGSGIACGAVVNCAGPAAASIAAMAGVELPVERRKRCVFVFDARSKPEGPFPLIVDPSGVWVRAEPPHFMAGMPPPFDPAVAPDDFAPDRRLFEDLIWPALVHRIPAFDALLVKHAWAGHYAYNTLDRNAVVGPAGHVSNLIFANGFSGHGLQHAAGVGRGVSELVTYGEYRTLDLTPLGYERIAAGEPLHEHAIV